MNSLIAEESETWVFLNGKYMKEREASLPVTDRGFLFGDGVFTSLRIDEGKVEFLEAHLHRLYDQCRRLHLEPPAISLDEIDALIEKQQAKQGTWRLKIILTGGEEPHLRLPPRKVGACLMTIKKYQLQPQSCRLCLYPEPVMRPLSSFKTLAYLDHFIVKEYAFQRHYDDAIICNEEGFLMETAFSNLFWIHQKSVYVPDYSLPYLKGIFLSAWLKEVEKTLHVHFVKVGLEDIPNEATVFICNALTHARAVSEIDRREFNREEGIESLVRETTQKALLLY